MSKLNKLVRNLSAKLRSVPVVDNGKLPLILLASIGNPERGYRGTRHSVGHFVLKALAERQGFDHTVRYGNSSFLSNQYRDELLMYESPSYMNESGRNVSDAWNNVLNSSKLISFNPVLVVLHDELDLALGKVRVRKQMSSHKGHNGIRSIQQHMGGGFIALSIGISRPESRLPNVVADYVLSRFTSSELGVLDGVVDRVLTIIQEMIEGKYIYEVNSR